MPLRIKFRDTPPEGSGLFSIIMGAALIAAVWFACTHPDAPKPAPVQPHGLVDEGELRVGTYVHANVVTDQQTGRRYLIAVGYDGSRITVLEIPPKPTPEKAP